MGQEIEMDLDIHRETRYNIYRRASIELHGFQGKGKRKKLPVCVYAVVRDMYPSTDGYTGFISNTNA